MAWTAPKHPNGISGGKKEKKTSTTITRKDGSQASGYISNGQTYYNDGSRISTGDSVTDVSGRQWTMGSDGKGVLTGYAEGSLGVNSNSPASGKYNTDYGYSGGGSYPAQQIDFDAERYKQEKLDALIAELTGQYNTNMANLDKTYNANVSTANSQIDDVKNQYLNTINQLDEDTYNAYKLANQRASARGLTSSNQGEAMLNTIAVNSSKQRADINTNRDSTINDIQSKINDLSANYGIDKDTMEKNYGADKLKAMSQTELEAIQMKLDIDKYNIDWANKYKLQDYQNQFTAGESQKDRDATSSNLGKQLESNKWIAQLDSDTKKWISQLDNDTQKYVAGLSANAQTAVARIGANSSLSAAKYSAQLASKDQGYANKLALAGLQFTTAVNNGMSEAQATAKYITPIVQ